MFSVRGGLVLPQCHRPNIMCEWSILPIWLNANVDMCCWQLLCHTSEPDGMYLGAVLRGYWIYSPAAMHSGLLLPYHIDHDVLLVRQLLPPWQFRRTAVRQR